MKKSSTVAAAINKNFERKLTIGLDLGDRSSWYCVLDEAGEVISEQKLGTTPKAMKEVLPPFLCQSAKGFEATTHDCVSHVSGEGGRRGRQSNDTRSVLVLRSAFPDAEDKPPQYWGFHRRDT